MKQVQLIILIYIIGFTASFAEDKVNPLPDPPSLEKRIEFSEIILQVRLLHSRKVVLGSRILSQPRFEVIKVLKPSIFFKIEEGTYFTVNHELRPNEWGPYFQESPEAGEYILFLNLRNIDIGGKIFYYTELYTPHPFALESIQETPVEEIQTLIHSVK